MHIVDAEQDHVLNSWRKTRECKSLKEKMSSGVDKLTQSLLQQGAAPNTHFISRIYYESVLDSVMTPVNTA
jgi:hypothetical protein